MADDDYSEKVCKVYDKDDFFTVFVQLMLAAFALGSLWFKRMFEQPKRKFLTWFYDVSKQGFGACYAHILNMIIAGMILFVNIILISCDWIPLFSSRTCSHSRFAALLAKNLKGTTQLTDECAWYGMSYLIDTTLGLVLAVIFVKALDYLANKFNWEGLKKSGVYHGDDGVWHWIQQVLAWLGILTIVKVLIYLFMWGLAGPLATVGGLLFAPLQGNIRFELLFVMIVFPGFLNVIYFWIADSFLQAKAEHKEAHEEDHTMEDKREALLTEAFPVEDPVAAARPWTDVDVGTPIDPKETALV